MKKLEIGFVLVVGLCSLARLQAQYYDMSDLEQINPCSENPSWRAAPCSVHQAFDFRKDSDRRSYELRALPAHTGRDRWEIQFHEANDVGVWVDKGLYVDNRKIATIIADVISTLPHVILYSLPPNVTVNLTNDYGRWMVYYREDNDFAHWIEINPERYITETSVKVYLEEQLLHEFIHVIDVGFQSVYLSPHYVSERKADLAHTNNVVMTRYGVNNEIEDFAETFTVYLAMRRDQYRPEPLRRLDPQLHYALIERTIPNRARWFDDRMVRASHNPRGRLFSDLNRSILNSENLEATLNALERATQLLSAQSKISRFMNGRRVVCEIGSEF